MSRDRARRGSQRRIERPSTPPGALRDLKDFLYRLYLEAGAPPVARIAGLIAADDLPGLPSKDTVHRIVGSPDVPPSQPDTVTVAAALAKEAGWDIDNAMIRVRDLWVAAQLAAPLGDDVAGLDPFALGVSRAINLGDPSLPVLPRSSSVSRIGGSGSLRTTQTGAAAPW